MARHKSTLRIIGGDWRSRRIPFAAAAGVRPTPDRIRETLFNWLQPYITAASCLDLFSGSGALSFEALSRGARCATLVDQDLRVIQQLQRNAELLKTDKATMIWKNALEYLSEASTRYDIVFLDPPFRENLLGECCLRLERGGWLADAAWIYMERGSHQPAPELPGNWRLTHSKQSGEVHYTLARRGAPCYT